MLRRRLFVLVGLLVLSSFLVPSPVGAQSEEEGERTVRVLGEGTVSVPPDKATVRFGVVTRADAPEAARAENAAAARNAMNAVRELGIADSKIRMETLRLQPRREHNPETDAWEEKGYEATRQVVVEADSLDRVPRLVATVVQRGANRLEGIEYGLRDRAPARNEALRQAAQAARDKAHLLARALGAGLGPVRQIDEQNFSFQDPSPRIQRVEASAYQTAADPEPEAYAAGEIEVEARVQVVFGLEPSE